jgi:hypothetical protein
MDWAKPLSLPCDTTLPFLLIISDNVLYRDVVSNLPGVEPVFVRLPRASIEPAKSLEKVGLTGLEPVTLRLSSACSNQLSYRPGIAGFTAKFTNFDCRFSILFRGALRAQLLKSAIANRKSKMKWRQGDSNP